MTTPEIIGRAFRLYAHHLAALVMVAVFPHAAFLLAYTVFDRLTGDVLQLNLLTMLATVVMNAIALAAITIAVAVAVAVDVPRVGTVYRLLGRSRLVSLVVAYLLTVLMTSVAFIPMVAGLMQGGLMLLTLPLLMIPGLVLGGLFAATIPVIVLERLPALPAIARSTRLMRGNLTQAMAIFAFVLLISGFLPMAFQLSVGLGPLSPLLNTVLGSALLPLAYTANVLLYFSARAGEGYSAAVLARDVLGA